MKRLLAIVLLATGAASCGKNESPSPSNTSTQPAATSPDNTGINTRDRAAGTMTAGEQGQSKNEVQMAADIRKKIMDAKLSTNAENCKVIVDNGKVTLRGPVKSQAEKDTIGRIATDVAGADKVDNQLEVSP